MLRQLILATALAAITYLCPFSIAQAQQNNSAFAFAERIGHGINLGNALEAPTEGAWGVVLKEEYFKAIKDAGFSHVRLPVRWSAHALQTPPYTIDSTFMERVAWAISEAQKYNLAIIVDMHDYDELQKAPGANQERFESMWKQIAERFSHESNDVAFELYNEPSNSLDSQRWNNLLIEILHVVRQTNPHRIIVIGPVQFNSIDKLPELALPEADRDVLVTVHFYEPHQFTHQGAEWIGSESNSWLGTKWFGTDAEVQAISGRFDQASGWGKQHERPLYLGEFGAYEKADMESRVRWTRTVVEQATKRGMATAYWEFCSGFGAYDPQQNCWRQPLLKALTE